MFLIWDPLHDLQIDAWNGSMPVLWHPVCQRSQSAPVLIIKKLVKYFLTRKNKGIVSTLQNSKNCRIVQLQSCDGIVVQLQNYSGGIVQLQKCNCTITKL